jgi:Fic family protein
MRLPQKPPPLGAPFCAPDTEAALRSADAALIVADAARTYVPWDEFRHRYSAPEGVKLETLWRIMRQARWVTRRVFPLCTAAGAQFSFNMPDAAYEDLAMVDRFRGGVPDMSPAPVAEAAERERFLVSSLMEEAITSSQMEGAAVTRVQAKEMLRTGRRPRDRSERMVLNNYRTMQRIKELKDRPLSPGMILELQRVVTEGTLDKPDAAGRFRRPEEHVEVVDSEGNVLFTPPPAEELPQRAERLCAFANDEGRSPFIHPVVRAILLHFWLAYDHPFVDGNGRTARALFYWHMLKSEYRLMEFVSISSVMRESYGQYRDAFLYAETDDEDATYFIAYHLKAIRQALARLREYVARKRRDAAEMVRLLDGRQDLNHRKLAVLHHALRHRNTLFTFRSHATSHGVTHATARKDLLDLAARGLLEKRKRGREFVFIPPQDLHERLNPGEEGTRSD